jgi:hypothetical protein
MVELLNMQSLLYVGFRLAPFILVSFFALSSLFNSDLKGIIFLAMLLLNCFVTTMIGNMFPDDTSSTNPYGVCQSMSLTKIGHLSRNFPLNINVLTFTFAYLIYIIIAYDAVNTNIPTIVVFSVFILYQWYWSAVNGCNSPLYSFASLAIGFGLGYLFSYCVDKMGIVQLQYFNGIKNQEVCTRAKNQQFQCTTKPNV